MDYTLFANKFAGPVVPLCNTNPQPLGTASPGISPRASRCDHVHPFPIGARVSRVAVQTVASGAITALSFDTLDYDTGGFFNVANPTRLTVPQDGIYLFTASGSFAANAAGNRFITPRINGVTLLGGGGRYLAIAANSWVGNACVELSLSANDYMENILFQSSGGNLNTLGATFDFMSVRLVG